MGKTLILGNNPDKEWIKSLGLSTFQVPNISIGRNSDLVEFVKNLPTNLDCVIIDSDSLNIDNLELSLDIALYIRMMLHDCLKTALSQIVIVSDLPIEAFMGYGVKSMVLMTKGILLTENDYIKDAIEQTAALTPTEYIDGFLSLIKVEPQEKVEGRHSIANEWGAEILAKVISNGNSSIANTTARNSLYFRYSSLVSLNASEIKNIIDKNVDCKSHSISPILDSIRYLLIDDEAEKGWGKVLDIMLPNSHGTIFNDRVSDYNQLPESIRNGIEHCEFDLIFLDLRMNGVEEEFITVPDDFSGMKILKSIKSINPGLQVIMLTATNKSWNLKALIDAGANGYYMKEAPEYHFPIEYSYQNAEAFSKTISSCFEKSFMSKMWTQIKVALLKLESDNLPALRKSISLNWESGYNLLSKCYYKDSLMQFMLALEAYANQYTMQNPETNEAIVYLKDVDFNSQDKEDYESCIFDNHKSFFKIEYGLFPKFQRGKKAHPINITMQEEKAHGYQSLNLALKIAAVISDHLNDKSLYGIKKVCELIFIRNQRLAHFGSNSEFIEEKRPITIKDCKFIFELTYKLIMTD